MRCHRNLAVLSLLKQLGTLDLFGYDDASACNLARIRGSRLKELSKAVPCLKLKSLKFDPVKDL